MNLKEARTMIKDYEANEEETITILYKDGSIETLDSEYDGHKVSLVNIVSVVDSNPCTFMVYGTFEINDACVVTVNDVEVIDEAIKEVETWDYVETAEVEEVEEVEETENSVKEFKKALEECTAEVREAFEECDCMMYHPKTKMIDFFKHEGLILEALNVDKIDIRKIARDNDKRYLEAGVFNFY